MASQRAEIKGIQCCFLALILANKDFSESFKEADDKILTVQLKQTNKSLKLSYFLLLPQLLTPPLDFFKYLQTDANVLKLIFDTIFI